MNTSFLNQGMTVAQLRQALGDFNPADKVVFAHPSGDHWHTTVCSAIRNVDQGDVAYSEYHRLGKLIEEEDEKKTRPETVSVVVLNIA